MTSIARRLRSLRGERGVTLIELLVAMVIFGILLTVVSGLYISAMNTVSLTRGLTDNTKVVSNAMNAVSRSIRAATENPVAGQTLPDSAFVSAKDDEVVLYAYINLTSSEEQPVMIRYRIDRTSGALTESRWPATQLSNGNWKFPALTVTPDYTRTVAVTISPYTSGDHPFTYLSKNGTVIAAPASGLSLDNRRLVASVRITLTVQSSLTDSANPVTLQNTVGIPNLGFAEDAPL